MNETKSSNPKPSVVSPEMATKLNADDKRNYIRRLFDNISSRYDFIRTLIFLGHTSLWYRQALSDLDLKAGDKVLDVGCGTGESTRYLINRYPGINVEGMDLSPGMLNPQQSSEGDSFLTSRPSYDKHGKWRNQPQGKHHLELGVAFR